MKHPGTAITLNTEEFSILREQDVMLMRKRIQERATRIRMGLVNQTKLQTAASELVRNMIRYAGNGKIILEVISFGLKAGIRLTVADNGPGIPNMDDAMKEGFSTAKSLGLGLPGAKKLCDSFEITSETGKGTTVIITKMA